MPKHQAGGFHSHAPTKRPANDSSAQGIKRDDRGQDQPADKQRAQQTSSQKQHGRSDPPLHPKPRE